MSYELRLTPLALEQMDLWARSGQKKTLTKLLALFDELKAHPTRGTGRPEQLRGNYPGYWSRRIDKANRLVYSVAETTVTVTVVSVRGHYDDK